MTDDTTVRAAFDELKTGALRAVPPFDAVLKRPTAPHVKARTSHAVRLLAAGVVIAAAAATYAKLSATHQRLTVPAEVVALGAWRPATDVLLPRTDSVFGTTPVLRRSILDLDTLTTGAIR